MAAAAKRNSIEAIEGGIEHTCRLPDECLALIFDYVEARNICKLVCRRWLAVEAPYRRKLTIKIHHDYPIDVPSLLARYSGVSELALFSFEFRQYKSIDLVSLSNLTRLHLENWILTHSAMTALASNCPQLGSFSCKTAKIADDRVITALVDGCPLLHSISLRDIWIHAISINPKTTTSLRSINLDDLNAPVAALFGPLLACSPNLATLEFHSFIEKPDPLFANISASLVEINVRMTMTTDNTLFAISRCTNLQVLHIYLHALCTNAGLLAVANNCRLLRRIHIGGSGVGKLLDEAIVAVLTCCRNLRELDLGNIKVTSRSLTFIATNCRNLEHLALFRILAFGDTLLSSIAANCISLKTLTLIGCPVSDHGIEALANGCPNLVELSLGHYRIGPTCMRLLKSKRARLIVKSQAPEDDMDFWM